MLGVVKTIFFIVMIFTSLFTLKSVSFLAQAKGFHKFHRGFARTLLITSSPNFLRHNTLNKMSSYREIGDSKKDETVTIKEDVVFQGYRSIVKQTVKLPNGKLWEVEVLRQKHESVVVFIWNSSKKTTTLVREYHPGPEQNLYGTVAGMFEPWKHSSPLECAQHELEEEARVRTNQWYPLLHHENTSMPFDKYSNNRFYPFLAIDPETVENPRLGDEEEFIEVYEDVSYSQIIDMIQRGEMNVVSTYTIFLAFKKLDDLGIDYK
jgi:hypothetical protein